MTLKNTLHIDKWMLALLLSLMYGNSRRTPHIRVQQGLNYDQN